MFFIIIFKVPQFQLFPNYCKTQSEIKEILHLAMKKDNHNFSYFVLNYLDLYHIHIIQHTLMIAKEP